MSSLSDEPAFTAARNRALSHGFWAAVSIGFAGYFVRLSFILSEAPVIDTLAISLYGAGAITLFAVAAVHILIAFGCGFRFKVITTVDQGRCNIESQRDTVELDASLVTPVSHWLELKIPIGRPEEGGTIVPVHILGRLYFAHFKQTENARES